MHRWLTLFIIVVFGACAFGALLRLVAVVYSLRSKRRLDRIPAIGQLAASVVALGGCAAAVVTTTWVWEALIVFVSYLVYRLASVFSRWEDEAIATPADEA